MDINIGGCDHVRVPQVIFPLEQDREPLIHGRELLRHYLRGDFLTMVRR